jgi:RTX calcium-binding nonapeptide repeat (4 copies)
VADHGLVALCDRLLGLAGNDALLGHAGDDCLSGGRGSDRLGGGPGDDRLRGGPGRDAFSGGAGNDTLGSRDGLRDGPLRTGTHDRVTADRSDRLIGCERVTPPARPRLQPRHGE